MNFDNTNKNDKSILSEDYSSSYRLNDYNSNTELQNYVSQLSNATLRRIAPPGNIFLENNFTTPSDSGSFYNSNPHSLRDTSVSSQYTFNTNSEESTPNFASSHEHHADNSDTNAIWTTCFQQQLLEVTLNDMKSKVYEKFKQLYPFVATEFTPDRVISELHTKFSCLLQGFIKTWNETEDINYSEYVHQIKILQDTLTKYTSNGQFATAANIQQNWQEFRGKNNATDNNNHPSYEDTHSNTLHPGTIINNNSKNASGSSACTVPSRLRFSDTSTSEKEETTNLFLDSDDPFHNNDNPSMTEIAKVLQDRVDIGSELFRKWRGTLKLELKLEMDIDLRLMNIFDYSDPAYKDIFMYNMYFCNRKFNPSLGFEGKAWKDLIEYIETTAADKFGFKLAVSKGKDNRVNRKPITLFKCKHGAKYRGELEDNYKKEYRGHKRSFDRMMSRGKEGKNMPRRIESSRAINDCEACKFQFKVSYNDKGFFICPGFGCDMHSGHLHIETEKCLYPERFLKKRTLKKAKQISRTSTHLSNISSIVYEDENVFMSRQSLHYYCRKKDTKKQLNNKILHGGTDKVLNLFKSKGVPHMALFADYDGDKKDLNIMYNLHDMSEGDKYEEVLSGSKYTEHTDKEKSDADEYVSERRTILGLNDKQKLLVAFAWCTINQRIMFDSCPEVIFIDTLKGTNNEDRPLLTVSGRRYDGKMFIILQVFMPHERRWIFRWILCVVMPKLFGEELLLKVRVINSDGDAQEMAVIDDAILLFFRNAIRNRCGWHVIDRGWHRLGPKSGLSRKAVDVKQYKRVRKILMRWMYTWCNGSCRTEGEFRLSFFIMIKYINSKDVLNRVGQRFVNHFKDFLRRYMQNNMSHFVFYRRAHIRHFYLYTSSLHEGTNKAIKYGGLSVSPNYSLEKTVQVLLDKAENASAMYDKDISLRTDKKSVWVDLACSEKLSVKGILLLKDQWDARLNYTCIRIGKYIWLVKPNQKVLEKRKKSVIPEFDRVSEVKFIDGVFVCSCNNFKIEGIPCRHIYCILTTFESYTQPSHRDLSIIYRRDYAFFMQNRFGQYKAMYDLYSYTRENDIQGPSCCEDCFHHVPIVPQEEMPAEYLIKDSVCLNYDTSNVTKEMVDDAFDSPIGLTQKYFDYDGLDEYYEPLSLNDDDSDASSIYDDDTQSLDFDNLEEFSLTDEVIQEIKESTNNQMNIEYINQLDQQSNSSKRQVTNTLEEEFQRNEALDTQDLTPRHSRSPYQACIQPFKECTSAIENYGNEEDIDRLKKILKHYQSEIMQDSARDFLSQHELNGEMVSCMIPSRKKRKKHHGCDGR